MKDPLRSWGSPHLRVYTRDGAEICLYEVIGTRIESELTIFNVYIVAMWPSDRVTYYLNVMMQRSLIVCSSIRSQTFHGFTCNYWGHLYLRFVFNSHKVLWDTEYLMKAFLLSFQSLMLLQSCLHCTVVA